MTRLSCGNADIFMQGPLKRWASNGWTRQARIIRMHDISTLFTCVVVIVAFHACFSCLRVYIVKREYIMILTDSSYLWYATLCQFMQNFELRNVAYIYIYMMLHIYAKQHLFILIISLIYLTIYLAMSMSVISWYFPITTGI